MEDMIRKIAGLLSTAESLAEMGNQEAADAYIQKAHELQQKYSIDAAMLAAKGEKVDKIIERRIPMPGVHGRRRMHLAHYVALATSCTGYFNRTWDDKWNRTYEYVVFGFEKDVEWVDTLLHSLNHQLDLALAAGMKTKPEYENGRSFAVAFVEGFAQSISRRLKEANRAAKAEAEKGQREEREKVTAEAFATGGEEAVAEVQKSQGLVTMSLVLADKKKRVEEEMTATVGKLGSSSTSRVGGDGYRAGRAAGERANLARGSVKGGSKGSLRR